MKHLLMLLIVLALHNLAYSANIIWTNANANNSWNDPQNWSSGTVPGSADIAIFDGSSTANCNLGVNLNVLGFRINAGYTGTITQNVGTYITVGNSDFVQAAGVFLGGNSKIDINGNYTLNGGIFTSTSDLLQVKNDFTFTGGTFGHNSGTVFFDGNTQNVTGSLTFSNVTLNLAWGGGNWIINNNININGALSIGGDQDTDIEGTGLINCLGNINLSNTHYGGGTGTINISGSSNQSVFGAAPVNRCALPHVIINKSGGQVTFSGTTTVFGNWTYIAGSTDYSTNNSTILLNGRNRQITGIQTFQNLSFFTAWGGGAFDFMDDVTIKSKLTIQGAQATHLNGPGRVNCEGDIDLVGNMTGNNGNAVIHIIGNANQLIRGHNNIGWCELPNITINKSGGIATFDNTVSLTRDWTYTAGTIDYLANNAVIGFTGSNQAINGVQDFENLHVLLSWGGGDLNVMNNITVKRKFTISGNQNTDLNGPGLVNCIGDIDLLGNMTGNNGNAIVNITGTANQLITGHINLGWCELPNVTINKSGGIATFANTVSLVRNWTYTAGTVDHISQNSTIAFTGINQVINGVQDFENLHLRLAWGGGDVDVMDNITVKHKFTISGNQNTDLNGPALVNCEGDIDLLGNMTGNNGNAIVNITGTANQLITGHNNIGWCELPNVTLNKSGGIATFDNTVSLTRDWTYTAGMVDHASRNSTIAFTGANQKIFGVQDFENLHILLAWGGGDLDVMNNITTKGIFTLSGSHKTDIDGPGIINCEGDLRLNNSSYFCYGDGTINISGGTNQAIGGTSGVGEGELPNVTINKTGGIATFSNEFNFNRNFTYSQGVVDATTNLSRFNSYGQGSFIDAEANNGTKLLFHNLQLSGLTTSQTLLGNLEVNHNLHLNATRLRMNGNEISLNNPAPAALTIANNLAMLVSESVDNSGKVHWNIGTDQGNHIFWFGNAAYTPIPFHFQITDNGDVGILSVSTYPTISDNTPYPLIPDVVTNLSSLGSADNSTNVIDRFWQIDRSGPSGTATMSFSYAQADVSGGVIGNENALEAQRYRTVDDTWSAALPGQVQNAATNRVTVPGVSTFSPWTLALNSSPLPVEGLEFFASLNGVEVDLNWKTVTEVGNNYFKVERSNNGFDWEGIIRVEGAGNSSLPLNYHSIDHHPYAGLSYYRLMQVSFDGDVSYSEVRSVNFAPGAGLLIFPNPSSNLVTIQGESRELEIVQVYNMLGQDVTAQVAILSRTGGQIVLGLNNLANGVYSVRTRTATHKLYKQ